MTPNAYAPRTLYIACIILSCMDGRDTMALSKLHKEAQKLGIPEAQRGIKQFGCWVALSGCPSSPPGPDGQRYVSADGMRRVVSDHHGVVI